MVLSLEEVGQPKDLSSQYPFTVALIIDMWKRLTTGHMEGDNKLFFSKDQPLFYFLKIHCTVHLLQYLSCGSLLHLLLSKTILEIVSKVYQVCPWNSGDNVEKKNCFAIETKQVSPSWLKFEENLVSLNSA